MTEPEIVGEAGPALATAADFDGERMVLSLHAESVDVSKVRSESIVRVVRTTTERHDAIDEELAHELVLVERVPIGTVVDAMPLAREEGDTIVFPVVEEIVVTERRLFLKEEVRVRRVREIRRHQETVVLREQNITVSRSTSG